ncbi:MAG: hypothetical protein JWM31_3107 [Solirubrobacterales bacterium]|nr:hypothetical protein [Solirubrobacterales bacterium]
MPQTTAITRLTLLPTAPRERGDRTAKIRRYRLASVRPPAQDPAARFTHLKHGHD